MSFPNDSAIEEEPSSGLVSNLINAEYLISYQLYHIIDIIYMSYS